LGHIGNLVLMSSQHNPIGGVMVR